jgi:ornithine carbamoyltransferase
MLCPEGSAEGEHMKHLISVQDLKVEEIMAIFKRAKELKDNPKPLLKGKVLAMLFEKPSTRTRVSFEVAMDSLGGKAIVLDQDKSQLSRGESIGDTARVMSRYCHAIMARVNDHKSLEELASASGIPVINGLSDRCHPCQALSDMFTVHEKKGQLHGLKLCFVGVGNDNVAHSLCLACSKLGVDMTVACPQKYAPDKAILAMSRANSKASGARIEVLHDPKKALKGADVIYTDTWFSMGDKAFPQKRKAMKPYQLNSRLLGFAKKDAIVMHCLPAHRGEEITDSVIDGDQSVVWDQAENRLHLQRGLLSVML